MGATVVKKFGGSSLATVDHIKQVTNLIKKSVQQGEQLIIVVSAMSDTTDKLVKTISQVNEQIDSPEALLESDKILSTGEQIACSMLVLSLLKAGIKAKSLLGWQVPIISDDNYGSASIQQICTKKLISLLKEEFVVVVAGFQAVYNHEVTTLGRNSSDVTATALAAALGCRCEIYTDVEGIYSADPKIVNEAQIIQEINYSHMLCLASLGAKIIHPRAMEIAKKGNIPLSILSSVKEGKNSLVTSQKIESPLVSLTFLEELACCEVYYNTYLKINSWLAANNKILKFSFSSMSQKWLVVIPLIVLQQLITCGIIEKIPFKEICAISLVGNSLVNVAYILKSIDTLLKKEHLAVDYVLTYDKVIVILLPVNYLKKALNILHSIVLQQNYSFENDINKASVMEC